MLKSPLLGIPVLVFLKVDKRKVVNEESKLLVYLFFPPVTYAYSRD